MQVAASAPVVRSFGAGHSGPLLEQLRGALVVNAQSKLGGRGIGVKLLPLTVGR